MSIKVWVWNLVGSDVNVNVNGLAIKLLCELNLAERIRMRTKTVYWNMRTTISRLHSRRSPNSRLYIVTL